MDRLTQYTAKDVENDHVQGLRENELRAGGSADDAAVASGVADGLKALHEGLTGGMGGASLQ